MDRCKNAGWTKYKEDKNVITDNHHDDNDGHYDGDSDDTDNDDGTYLGGFR